MAVRCLSGGFCLSLAVLTFGVHGVTGAGTAVVSVGVPDRDVAVSPTLRPGAVFTAAAGTTAATTGAAQAAAAGAVTAAGDPAAGFTTDPRALVAYSRSAVLTGTKDGTPGELNVASSGLKRPAEGFLMAPLEVLNPSSPFGLRTSPLSGVAGEFHWGQDFAAACGTRVYAADAGVVRAVGWHPWGGGNRVEIDHGNGLITTYNHLEGIAVKKGDSVRVGEVIAKVGTTGSSTGCHLHFETILNGVHKDPRDWTFLPITQTDPLGPLEMTSYAPDAGLPSNASLGWAIPVSDDGRHEVANGAQEIPAALLPQLPGYTASYSPSPSPTADALSPTRPPPSAAGQAPGTSAPVTSEPVTGAPPATGTTTGSPTTSTPPASTTPPGTTPPPTTPPLGSEPPSTPPPVTTPPAPPATTPAPPPVTEAPPPVVTPPPVVEVPPPPPPVVEPPPPPPPVVEVPPPAPAPPPVVTPPPVTSPAPELTAPPVTADPAPSGTPAPTGTVTP
ncbi:peptidoglycan DD-metalloendopeptidase family protein [Arthrobacter sp. NPDC080086]|uniref:peptidoglycan DD-metalloendopeptidase family protein n=1 Tax=Arthrobacter sp. NPDC080086 TaxID=3155917 RepID=UPI003450E2A8